MERMANDLRFRCGSCDRVTASGLCGCADPCPTDNRELEAALKRIAHGDEAGLLSAQEATEIALVALGGRTAVVQRVGSVPLDISEIQLVRHHLSKCDNPMCGELKAKFDEALSSLTATAA